VCSSVTSRTACDRELAAATAGRVTGELARTG